MLNRAAPLISRLRERGVRYQPVKGSMNIDDEELDAEVAEDLDEDVEENANPDVNSELDAPGSEEDAEGSVEDAEDSEEDAEVAEEEDDGHSEVVGPVKSRSRTRQKKTIEESDDEDGIDDEEDSDGSTEESVEANWHDAENDGDDVEPGIGTSGRCV